MGSNSGVGDRSWVQIARRRAIFVERVMRRCELVVRDSEMGIFEFFLPPTLGFNLNFFEICRGLKIEGKRVGMTFVKREIVVDENRRGKNWDDFCKERNNLETVAATRAQFSRSGKARQILLRFHCRYKLRAAGAVIIALWHEMSGCQARFHNLALTLFNFKKQ